jgi:hypothetical protein
MTKGYAGQWLVGRAVGLRRLGCGQVSFLFFLFLSFLFLPCVLEISNLILQIRFAGI